MSLNNVDPRYPVGRFTPPATITPGERTDAIATLAELPEQLRNAVDGLSFAQLGTPYREGGWTLRQVVHHVPDSHMNAYMRTKLTLTEDSPTIKPYDEAEWAKLADMRDTPIETSLTLLESLHGRWDKLLRSLRDDDFRRTFKHPEQSGTLTIDWLVALYAWHGRHHTAHITSTRERMRW